MPMHVREAELAALEAESEAFVVDAEHGNVVMETAKFSEGVMGHPRAVLSQEPGFTGRKACFACDLPLTAGAADPAARV